MTKYSRVAVACIGTINAVLGAPTPSDSNPTTSASADNTSNSGSPQPSHYSSSTIYSVTPTLINSLSASSASSGDSQDGLIPMFPARQANSQPDGVSTRDSSHDRYRETFDDESESSTNANTGSGPLASRTSMFVRLLGWRRGDSRDSSTQRSDSDSDSVNQGSSSSRAGTPVEGPSRTINTRRHSARVWRRPGRGSKNPPNQPRSFSDVQRRDLYAQDMDNSGLYASEGSPTVAETPEPDANGGTGKARLPITSSALNIAVSRPNVRIDELD